MNVALVPLIALLAFSAGALSQPQANGLANLANVELDRIRAERGLADKWHAEQEILCYQLFAVNDCLGQARAKRRTIAADLRRQELSISANEARRRGAAQISRSEEKTSPEALREAEKRLQDAQAGQQARLEALEAKAVERAKAQEESAARLNDYQLRRQAQRDAERERAAKQAEADANRRNYELKLKAAADRKSAQSKPGVLPKAAAPPVVDPKLPFGK